MHHREERAAVAEVRVVALDAGEEGDEVRLVLAHVARKVRELVAHRERDADVVHVDVDVGLKGKRAVDAADVEVRHDLRKDDGLRRAGRVERRVIRVQRVEEGFRARGVRLHAVGEREHAVFVLSHVLAQGVRRLGQRDAQFVELFGGGVPHGQAADRGERIAAVVRAVVRHAEERDAHGDQQRDRQKTHEARKAVLLDADQPVNAAREVDEQEQHEGDQAEFPERKGQHAGDGGKELRVDRVDRHGVPLGEIRRGRGGEVQREGRGQQEQQPEAAQAEGAEGLHSLNSSALNCPSFGSPFGSRRSGSYV